MKTLETRRAKIYRSIQHAVNQTQSLKNDIECWNKNHPDDLIDNTGEAIIIEHLARIKHQPAEGE